MEDLLRTYRRDLHQIPELDFHLPKTLSYIEHILQGYRCTLTHPIPSSIAAYFDFGQADTLAFRSDMDALPILEQNDVPYASKHDGQMHACGHDGHMAMLLGFAKVLNERTTCKHNVLLIFQPAEETTGGAQRICESGIFKKHHVSSIFGFHLWPTLPAGQIASRPGAFMAKSSEVSIEVHGVSAHAAKAWLGKDALLAAVEFLHRAYAMERQINSNDLHLLKFGKLESGTVRNVISNHTIILGTLRSFEKDVFETMKHQLQLIAKQVESETGCTFELTFSQGYPPLWNHEGLFTKCQTLLADMQVLEHPSMLAEDFAYYLQELPGVFLYIGTGNDIPLHADTFDFDESILLNGVETYQKLLEL